MPRRVVVATWRAIYRRSVRNALWARFCRLVGKEVTTRHVVRGRAFSGMGDTEVTAW
jgi:hypothetical protein